MGFEYRTHTPDISAAQVGKVLPFDFAARLPREEFETENSYRDDLTGLLNRAGFNNAFQEEMKASNTSGGTVMLIDFENIQKINAEYGRVVGDHCLQLLADVIDNITGPYDIKARVEGNKFMIAFTDIDSEIGEFKATRTGRTLDGLYLKIAGLRVDIEITTISAPYAKTTDRNNNMRPDLMGRVHALRQKGKTLRAIPDFLG